MGDQSTCNNNFMHSFPLTHMPCMHCHANNYSLCILNISGEEYESEIRKLEHKLSDYRNIIGQQEEMLLQVSVLVFCKVGSRCACGGLLDPPNSYEL